MTDSQRDTASAPVAVDLAAAEAAIVDRQGNDLTEAKEAIVEGLIGLTLEHVTGGGSQGERLYGAKPSGQLVSGFLLPRFDPMGMDETSDIRIATIGPTSRSMCASCRPGKRSATHVST